MYVAVKGGEKAIEAAHALMDAKRRGDREVPELDVRQIMEQMRFSVDRVMAEGSLYDPELAALAVKQACGDLVEAVFLVRAFRTTLPRFGFSTPVETDRMQVCRRVSAIFKDLPGGQMLGPTFDYTHRLLNFDLIHTRPTSPNPPETNAGGPLPEPLCRASALLEQAGLMENEPGGAPDRPAGDLTREPFDVPAPRDIRLQNLARGDEGFLLAMAYSYQRGFGTDKHPFVGEIRMGTVDIEVTPEDLGFSVIVGAVTVTECTMVNAHTGNGTVLPRFVKGYGLTFGWCERKAMSMSMVDRAMRWAELGGEPLYPVQDHEFVLRHSDNVESSGFVQHLKLPHYVDFQSELAGMRQMRRHFQSEKIKDRDHENAGQN